jgi:hypothetical protein
MTQQPGKERHIKRKRAGRACASRLALASPSPRVRAAHRVPAFARPRIRGQQDKQGKGYNMAAPVSDDFKYFTADVFSNPFTVFIDWFEAIGSIPETAFITLPKESKPAPKAAKKDKAVREVGKAGFFNLFGAGPTKGF